MSKVTELYLDKFWETWDALLNGILFVLIGLEILILPFNATFFVAGLIAIPLILIIRWISLSLPILFYKEKLEFIPKTGLIMTWGGLRGGISIALALSLLPEMNRSLILTVTYVVVVFSIVVQGLTIGKVVKKLVRVAD
jgi:CPA1 family monovalent cation:H+ antiporter